MSEKGLAATPRVVHVSAASADYDVTVGAGMLSELGRIARSAAGGARCCVVSETNVAPLYADAAEASLTGASYSVAERVVFAAGEQSKRLATLGEILEALAERELTRADVVVALGGGVTGDMAGLAAALYLRGVAVVQVPTSLLAMVDSSVGGKTAVDLTAGKNLAGAFCQPAAVICDTDCLKTLPPDVFADGAAEAVKTGVLSDEGLFALFEDGTLTA
ncbi:MAG TPA: 3-dehydroquinate synthase, partial [Olsenella sp.]|nr:3-dehydroquinate synthase [Olsenella sp.]